jgi:hypothetical protein
MKWHEDYIISGYLLPVRSACSNCPCSIDLCDEGGGSPCSMLSVRIGYYGTVPEEGVQYPSIRDGPHVIAHYA